MKRKQIMDNKIMDDTIQNESAIKAVNYLKERVADKNFDIFLDTLLSTKLLNMVPESELYSVLVDEEPVISIRKDKVRMEIIVRGREAFVYLDPVKCFNKPGCSSIFARFPMGNREYKQFESLWKSLYDPKSSIRKMWLKTAASYWYGQFASFPGKTVV